MKKIIVILCIFVLHFSCKKDAAPPAADTIYGDYFQDGIDTGDWTDWLNGVSIKVEPGNASYIKITISESVYTSEAFICDSVVLNGKSFTEDEMIQEGTLDPQYEHSTGSGHFGEKTISLDFTNYGNYHIIITNAKKTH